MAPSYSLDLAPEFLNDLETLYQPREAQAREDLSLCFVCLKWAAGNPDCLALRSCNLQRELARQN